SLVYEHRAESRVVRYSSRIGRNGLEQTFDQFQSLHRIVAMCLRERQASVPTRTEQSQCLGYPGPLPLRADRPQPGHPLEPIAEPKERSNRVPFETRHRVIVKPRLLAPRPLDETRPRVNMIEDDENVLAKCQRVLEEIRAIAASAQ